METIYGCSRRTRISVICFLSLLLFLTLPLDARAQGSVASEEAALAALEAFERQWSEKYPAIAPLRRKDRERLTPFFDYAPAIRKVVYTTNAIESLNYSLRKIVQGRGAFPNDDAVRKLLYLGLCEASKKWKRPIRDW